jgi:hypothetical protein
MPAAKPRRLSASPPPPKRSRPAAPAHQQLKLLLQFEQQLIVKFSSSSSSFRRRQLQLLKLQQQFELQQLLQLRWQRRCRPPRLLGLAARQQGRNPPDHRWQSRPRQHSGRTRPTQRRRPRQPCRPSACHQQLDQPQPPHLHRPQPHRHGSGQLEQWRLCPAPQERQCHRQHPPHQHPGPLVRPGRHRGRRHPGWILHRRRHCP